MWWFDLPPLRGGLLRFLRLTAPFLLSAIAIGVLISAFTRSLQQAPLLSFVGLFPMMFLSHTVGPVENMPEGLPTLSLASPLRHYLNITRGVFLKGSGLREL